MAISALESTHSSGPIRSPGSPRSGDSSCGLSINTSHGNNVKSATSKTLKSIKLSLDSHSPYLKDEKVHVKSRVTGKTLLSKKEESFRSSFPLAAKIYRANSDEFQNMKRNTKKIKKSVLTLPNVQAPKQQDYTVSDTNDSELFRVGNHELQPKSKRLPAPKKKTLGKRGSPSSQVFGYSADSSSFEMIAHFDGDVNRKKNISDRQNSMYRAKAYDVWTMLRNVNRFQFKPSPAISEESVITAKKTKVNRKLKYRKDPRVIQTRRADEVQYISNFDIETLSPSNSFCRASSSGRVTVIDKNDPFEDLCKEFQERIEQIERVGFYQDQPWTNKNKRKYNKSPKHMKVALKKEQPITKPLTVQEKMPSIPYDFTFMANNSDFSNTTSKITLQSKQNEVNNSNYNLKLTTKPKTDDSIYTANKPVNSNKSKPIQKKFTENISKKTKNIANEIEKLQTRQSPIQCLENISCISGITQVVLTKGEMNTQWPPQRSLSPCVKSRPTTTSRYLNSTTIPSQTFDVRRLGRLKYPITILGRDQVSSTYEVVTFDAPQFEGLGEKIWPFMTDWYKDSKGRNANGISKKVNKVFHYCWNRKPEEAKWNPNTGHTSMQKRKDGMATVNSGTTPRTPMAHFKDKMLKLLHKNPVINNGVQMHTIDSKIIRNKPKADSMIDVKRIEYNKPRSPVIRNRTGAKRPATLDSIIRQASIKVDDGSLPVKATRTIDLSLKSNSKGNNSVPNQKPSKKPRYTWAKASQASNLIDNVISKIRVRTGVYCNHVTGFSTEPLYEVFEKTEQNVSSLTPATVQPCATEILKHDEIAFTEVHAETDFDLQTDTLNSFGGFDETFPGLEVETISNKRVAIKNCIMNVLVHFDIAAPVGLKKSAVLNESKPSTCVPVPVTVTNNKTQIFKCTTTIVNAVLPAELCTILPNMMRNILLGPKVLPDMLPLDINKSQLSVITEISKGESHFFDALLFTSTMEWSPELKGMVCGRFNPLAREQKMKNPPLDFSSINDLLRPRPSPSNCIPIQTDFRSFCFTVNVMNRKEMRGPQCTALVPYNPPCHMLCNRNHFNFAKLNQISNLVSSIEFHYEATELSNEYGNIWNSCDFLQAKEHCNDRPACTALVKYIKPLRMVILERLQKTNEINKFSRPSLMKLKKKIKRKGFLRLFRRCKSTTNLTIERCTTALSKITNLEEFFFALGSGSTLCSVCDEDTERKILNSIIEMKNWISEISPRQTLLVLLLMNKKDTPNMLKLRPIILQAIAANRITRISELDMEVEVIERERFSKLPKCEGITYLPASFENYDRLLEELCWIAKTTASDFQKTFDNSSENLIKSLLDKRKKLNPSYLRVMARYVGLGLLKTPK